MEKKRRAVKKIEKTVQRYFYIKKKTFGLWPYRIRRMPPWIPHSWDRPESRSPFWFTCQWGRDSRNTRSISTWQPDLITWQQGFDRVTAGSNHVTAGSVQFTGLYTNVTVFLRLIHVSAGFFTDLVFLYHLVVHWAVLSHVTLLSSHQREFYPWHLLRTRHNELYLLKAGFWALSQGMQAQC